MTVELYGIRNCDTMKKAWTWLDHHGVDYVFHDYKREGVDEAWLTQLIERLGWEAVLNRAGTTFRKLDDAQKADLDAAKGIALMVANPSTIRRPVVEHPGGLLVGFKPEEWASALAG